MFQILPRQKKKDTKNQPKQPILQDALTGLHNRNYFKESFGELGSFKTDEYKTMVVFDIDRFKAVNDLFDGDRLLMFVVDHAKEIVGDDGDLYRWGGDEFMVIMRTTPQETLERFRELAKRVEEQSPLTISVGMVPIRLEDNIKTNYYRAVQRCYLVKEMGGNGVKLSDPWREREKD